MNEEGWSRSVPRSISLGFRLARLGALASILALALMHPLAAAGQPIRVGGEFQVNTFTNAQQRQAAVSRVGAGFVVAWQGHAQDGDSGGIFARRFSNAGTALASEFQVNVHTISYQGRPSVGSAADGGFVVAWESFQDGFNAGIFARRFSSAGVALTGEFQVNTFTLYDQRHSSVASAADGGFVVVWDSNLQDGSNVGVFARAFSSSGQALGSETQVNSHVTGRQGYPVVAATAGDEFVVAWDSNGQDGSSYGIFARRLSSAGVVLASEFQVNTHTLDYQLQPEMASSSAGDFIIAWSGNGQDGSSTGVFGQSFASAGVPLGSEFPINQHTPNYQFVDSATKAPDQSFLVVWSSNDQDGSSWGVFARRFSSEGLPLTGDIQVNTYTTSIQSTASVAAVNDTDFVVAWGSDEQDGNNTGIFAHRLRIPAVLDVDGNGDVDALTDALLILRYTFGFTGAVLTTGAVGNGCTRCDAPAIEAYLATVD